MPLDDVVEYQDDRSVKLWGDENQRKLYSTRVAVIGSGPLAQMILANMAGLGVKNICVMSNGRISRSDRNEFLCFKEDHNHVFIGKEKASQIKKTLLKIRESLNVYAVHSSFSEALLYPFGPEILIDATNSPESKQKCISYASKYNIPFFSASTNKDRGALVVFRPKNKIATLLSGSLESLLLNEFKGQAQGNYSSGVIAGLATEEVRKSVFQIKEYDHPLKNGSVIYYNINSSNRVGRQSDLRELLLDYYKEFNVLIIGAGAIGNFVALNLAMMGVGNIDIMDDDFIDHTNTHRQILFYGNRIGEKKAEVLCERIKEINPNVSSHPLVEKFTEGHEGLIKNGNGNGPYDLIFTCVDNQYSRYIINEFAVEYNVPVVDGGTGPTSGQVAVFVPGYTRCVTCQRNLKKKKKVVVNCREAEPSVVIPNIIIGSAMCGEAKRILYKGIDYTAPRILVYDAFSVGRLQTRPVLIDKRRKCQCQTKLN